MAKNTKKMKAAAPTAPHRGPGRPKAEIKWPARKFTIADAVAAQQPHRSKLTIIKARDRDMYMIDEKTGKPDKNRPRRNSLIVQLKGEHREPNHAEGLGRKCDVYILREKFDGASAVVSSPKVIKAVKPAKPVKVKPAKPTSDTPISDALDRVHAALTAPNPAPITVPAVEVTPAPSPAPKPAPVAVETPAPEAAPETSTAPAETAPVAVS